MKKKILNAMLLKEYRVRHPNSEIISCFLNFQIRVLHRVPTISAKLSDPPAQLTNVRHCPKGQLGQIWDNLGQK